MNRLDHYVGKLASMGATDLLLGGGHPPQYWTAQGLLPLPGEAALAREDLQLLLEGWLGRDRWARLLAERSLTCVASLEANLRVRVRCSWADHGATAQLRTLGVPRTLGELQLPEQLASFAQLERGLVIVTGPKCSGKTSLIAALLPLIAAQRSCHIVTLEAPIELLHELRGSSISQREVPRHAATFASGIRSALASDADVIAISAADEVETFELACRAAGSALVLLELPGRGGCATLERCLHLTATNPGATDLPEAFAALIALELVARRGGGRVPAVEIITQSPAVRAALRSRDRAPISRLPAADHGPGSQTREAALHALLAQGSIEPRDGMLQP
jgi:twitching motility protein PilT